jgi:hypothetical protein
MKTHAPPGQHPQETRPGLGMRPHQENLRASVVSWHQCRTRGGAGFRRGAAWKKQPLVPSYCKPDEAVNYKLSVGYKIFNHRRRRSILHAEHNANLWR